MKAQFSVEWCSQNQKDIQTNILTDIGNTSKHSTYVFAVIGNNYIYLFELDKSDNI